MATVPAGSVPEPGKVGPAATVIDRFLVTTTPAVSVTCATKDEVVPVTVPVIRPVGSIVRPVGSAPPLIDHVYAPVPPVAVSVCEYVAP